MENSNKSKDVVLEHAAVSGVVYVTVDKGLLYAHKFDEHVKLQIVFDKTDNNIIKHEQLLEEEIQNEEVKRETSGELEFCEEDNFISIDDDPASDLNSGVISVMTEKGNGCQETKTHTPVTVTVTEEDGQAWKLNKEVSNIKENEEVCNIKISSANRKISHCMSSKLQRNVYVGTMGNNVRPNREENTEQEDEKKEFSNSSEDSCDETSSKTDAGYHKISDQSENQQTIHCLFCREYFKSRKEYSCHRRSERKPHPCGKCGKIFKYKAHLIIHMREHNENKVEGSAVRSNKSNDNESDEKSKDVIDLQCTVCGNVLSNLANLKLHMMSHTKEYLYKCCVCGKDIRAVGTYNRHMESHSKRGQKVQCKICNIFFGSRGELSQHKLTHAFQCNLCGQAFPNRTGRYFHYKTFHKTDILKCPKCGKLYSCKKALAVHLSYHRNRHKTQCPVCGLLVFRLEKHMSSHSVTSDDNKKCVELTVFVCDKCPKQFTQMNSFKRHMKIHAEEKPYKCTECPKRFALSGGLNRHMVTHLKDKPFVCEVCGKACNQLGNLRVHMKTHKESKVVQCSQCGLEFTDDDALQQHTDKEHPQVHVLQPPEPYFQTNSVHQTFQEWHSV